MKKATKYLGSLLVVLTLIFTLSGCQNSFDASRYVKGTLDATKGEFADYVATTDLTEKEAQEFYEQSIDSEFQSLVQAGLPDELHDQYRELFEKMYTLTKYSVGDATKAEDKSYTVPVEIEPLVIFDGITAEITSYAEELTAEYMVSGEQPSVNDLTNKMFTHMYDLLNERVENPTYGAKKTMDVRVYLDSNEEAYTISNAQINQLTTSLIDIDSISF